MKIVQLPRWCAANCKKKDSSANFEDLITWIPVNENRKSANRQGNRQRNASQQIFIKFILAGKTFKPGKAKIKRILAELL